MAPERDRRVSQFTGSLPVHRYHFGIALGLTNGLLSGRKSCRTQGSSMGVGTPKMERTMVNRGTAFEGLNFEQAGQPLNGDAAEYRWTEWDSWLRAVLLAAVGVALIAVLVPQASVDRQRMLEATVRMERLARTLEAAKAITPDTANALSQLMQRPEFDCSRTICEGALKERNHAARFRLKFLLDRHGLASTEQ
jgi:hypothetical protein